MAAREPILAGLVFSGDLLREAEEDAEGGEYKEDGTRLVPGLKHMRPPAPETTATTTPSAVGGDGGLQYRASALRNSMAEAKKSGRSLEDVVRERWGSVKELTGGRDPDAFLRAAAAAERALPRRGRGRGRGKGRGGGRFGDGGRGRGDDGAPAKRSLNLGRDASDASLLKRYSQKLQGSLEAAVSGSLPEAAPRVPADDDARGEAAWVGLASRSTFGMTSSFKDGWRKRGPAAEPPSQPAATRPRPTPRAQPAPKPEPPKPAPPKPAPKPPAEDVRVVQGDGESNADAAAALRKRLGL